MEWLAGAALIVVLGFLLRGYLRSGHLHDPDADHGRWKRHRNGKQ